MTLNFYTLSVIYLVYSFLFGLGGGDGSRDHPGRKVCQPRCSGRPVLLYLRYHRRAAGREFRRPAHRAGLPVLCLHDGGNGDGMDHRQAVGTSAPPQVVGLFRQKIQSERLCVLWGNDVLLRLCAHIPVWLLRPAVWISLTVAVLDQIGSAVLVQQYAARHPVLEQLNQRLGKRSDTLRRRIALYIEKRIQYAYPAAARQEQTALRKGEKNFLSVSDLLWLFVIGAFLGDMVETVFCRVTAGVWMSRSSLVWGPFSVVWGLALVLATVLLRQEKDRSDRYLFAFGTVMGGVYEYVCSAVTELLFGTVFWDYSKFKFNLGGRINLLYCFFWGIAAVIWMRYGYPLVLRGMEKVRSRVRPWMTVLLAVFMAVNVLTSALALARYDARTSGEGPQNSIDTLLDDHFDDARMEHIYPNAKKVAKAG